MHEYLHMASANLEKQTVGFESDALPVTYNEALTQWLTLKLYYGQENMKEAIQNNVIYSESVTKIDAMIAKIGEEYVFNGFFEANIGKNTNELPKKYKGDWIDTIISLVKSNEEKTANLSLERLENNITAFLEKRNEFSKSETNEHTDR